MMKKGTVLHSTLVQERGFNKATKEKVKILRYLCQDNRILDQVEADKSEGKWSALISAFWSKCGSITSHQ